MKFCTSNRKDHVGYQPDALLHFGFLSQNQPEIDGFVRRNRTLDRYYLGLSARLVVAETGDLRDRFLASTRAADYSPDTARGWHVRGFESSGPASILYGKRIPKDMTY